MNDANARVVRSVLQFIAGGGLTALVAVLADGLSPASSAGLLAFNTLAVTMAQNFLEARGTIPSILKPKAAGVVVDKTGAVIADVVAPTVGAVEEVAGTVIDDLGEVVGGIGPRAEEEGEGDG